MFKKEIIFFFVCSFINLKSQTNNNIFFNSDSFLNFSLSKVNIKAIPYDSSNIFQEASYFLNSISDNNGNLILFHNEYYILNKNGEVIWNFINNPYTLTDNTAFHTQTIFIQKPKNKNIFYLFRINAFGNATKNRNLEYYEIDVSGNNGKGKINYYNKNLNNDISGQICATKVNNDTTWLVVHNNSENSLISYLIDKNGINSNSMQKFSYPKLIGEYNDNIHKFSPNSNLLSYSIGRFTFENNEIINTVNLIILKFNKHNGKFYNYYITNYDSLGKIEPIGFSSNSRYLFATRTINSKSYLIKINLEKFNDTENFKPINELIGGKGILGLNHSLYFLSNNPNSNSKKSIKYIKYTNENNIQILYLKTIDTNEIYVDMPFYFDKFTPLIHLTSNCSTNTISFEAINGYKDTFLWYFGDGNTALTDTNAISHTYTKSGTYNVKTIVLGTTDTIYKTIVIDNNILTPYLPKDTLLWVGKPYKFNLNPDTTIKYLWENGDTKFKRNIDTTTNYKLKIKYQECEKNYFGKISFLNIKFLKNYKCNNGNTNLNIIANADSITYLRNNTQYIINKIDTIFTANVSHNSNTLLLRCFLGNNYLDTLISIQNILIPSLNIGNDTLVCNNMPYILSVSNNYDSILWQNNTTKSNLNVTQKGYYSVSVKSNLCSLKDTIFLDFIDCNITNPIICRGQKADISFSAQADSILATIENKTYTTLGAQISHTFNNVGSIPVNFTLYKNGLKLALNTLVNVYDLPLITLPKDTILCKNEQIILKYFNIQNASITKPLDIRIQKQENIKYSIKNNNCSVTDSILIYFKNCNCNLYVPSAFSPNLDFINDSFYIKSECNILVLEFSIYNTWGEKIYQSYNTNTINWNAIYKDLPCPQGNYVWYLKYKDELNNTLQSKKGSFILLR